MRRESRRVTLRQRARESLREREKKIRRAYGLKPLLRIAAVCIVCTAYVMMMSRSRVRCSTWSSELLAESEQHGVDVLKGLIDLISHLQVIIITQ